MGLIFKVIFVFWDEMIMMFNSNCFIYYFYLKLKCGKLMLVDLYLFLF